MNIDKFSITLTEETYAYIHSKSEQEILEIFKNNLNEYLNTINTLVNQDLKTLSDEEFYNLLCKVYSIVLTEEDYLKILSKKNNKKYNRFTEIGTYMTFTDTATEGHGRDFSWWEQLYQVRYTIAVSEDTNLEYNITLKKEDIKKMIDDKSIVITAIKSTPLHNKLKINEEFEQFPLTQLNDTYSHIYGKKSGPIYKDDNFPIVISMLRRKFTKKRILRDMKRYIQELQDEIDMITLYSHQDYFYDKTSKLCKEWYNQSEEKEKISILKRQINTK